MTAGPGGKSLRLRQLPLNALLPNILTTLALCSGLTAIRFALAEKWQFAVGAIAFAALLDTLDGRLARLLKATTRFGAELDSLSDFLCFGVAPGLVVYLWTLHELGNFGWLAVLVFGVAMALRLARFNTALDDPNKPDWLVNFFTGVPAPAAAGLGLLPLILSFAIGDMPFRSPWIVFFWCWVVGFLMVSRLPTFSFKKIKVRRDAVLPVLFVVGLLATILATEPWITLSVVLIGYLGLLPFSWRSYQRYQLQYPYPAAPATVEPIQPDPELGWDEPEDGDRPGGGPRPS